VRGDVQGAAAGVDTVEHVGESLTPSGQIGVEPGAVVRDGDSQARIGAVELDVRMLRVRVTNSVLQCLHGAEVRGDLDFAGVARCSAVEHGDIEVGAARLRGQCSGQPLGLQQRRVDAAGDVAQRVDSQVGDTHRVGQPRSHLAGTLPRRNRAREPQLDLERDQLLLGAVMQVTFQGMPSPVLGRQHPLA